MKSTRLPKKALAQVYDKPMLIKLTERMDITGLPIIWCTSIHKDDNPIEQLGLWSGIPVYRGSELDVMGRFLEVADDYEADTIVRVTGDNPLTDPWLIMDALNRHALMQADYTRMNGLPRGVKPEIIDVQALDDLYDKVDSDESEYMTPMLEQMDRCHYICAPKELYWPELRLTVDYKDDLDLIRNIYGHFDGNPPDTKGIINYLRDFNVKTA